jgi:preprotein translocase subunit SecG
MSVLSYVLMFLLFFTAFFLIVLILIQRGKGGGLAGAFGGMGGQSAFGTKAGDLFTRITIGVAAFWIVLCVISVKFLAQSEDIVGPMGSNVPVEDGLVPGGLGGEKPGGEADGGAEDGAGGKESSDQSGE